MRWWLFDKVLKNTRNASLFLIITRTYSASSEQMSAIAWYSGSAGYSSIPEECRVRASRLPSRNAGVEVCMLPVTPGTPKPLLGSPVLGKGMWFMFAWSRYFLAVYIKRHQLYSYLVISKGRKLELNEKWFLFSIFVYNKCLFYIHEFGQTNRAHSVVMTLQYWMT